MAKYIDADALIEEMRKAFYIKASGEILVNIDDALNVIGNMPAADVEPVKKWIPCNEQLPKYGETVLCLCETGGITVSCITYKGTKPGEAVWFGRHYVKAWMPLSILPKMDGGSE